MNKMLFQCPKCKEYVFLYCYANKRHKENYCSKCNIVMDKKNLWKEKHNIV